MVEKYADAQLWDYNPKGKKPKSVDEMFKKSEDVKTDPVHDFEVKELTEKRDTLLERKKKRDEVGGLKREIRHLKTERVAEPLVSGSRKAIGFLRSGQSTLAHGASNVGHGRGGNVRWEHKSGLGLTDLSSSKAGSMGKEVIKKKEHYLEF